MSRLSLNSDIVFMAELLSVAQGQDLFSWHRSIRSYNCLHLPGKAAETPSVLRYAAAMNVLLAGLKIKDNRLDEGGWKWLMAEKIMQSPYRKAIADLEVMGLPVEKIQAAVEELNRREAEPVSGTMKEMLAHYAAPASWLTAVCMQYGAASEMEGKQLFRIGYFLGKIVYALDAWRDLEEDLKKKRFNCFQQVQIPVSAEAFASLIGQWQRGMNCAIGQLNMSPEFRLYFTEKLETNIARSFNETGIGRKIIHACSNQAIKYSFKQRWRLAGKTIGELEQPQKVTMPRLKKWAFAASVFLSILVSPAMAAVAKEHAGSGNFAWTDLLLAATGILALRKSCCCDGCCNECCKGGGKSSNNSNCDCKC